MNEVPWFRFWNESLTDPKIARIARLSKLPKATVMGVWVGLLCLASASPDRGQLLISDDMPFELEEILDEVGIDHESGQLIMGHLCDLGMVELDDDTYVIANWDKRQFKSDTSKERVRRHRERKRQAAAQNNGSDPGNTEDVYPKRYCNVTVTPPESESDTDINTLSLNARAHEEVDPVQHALELAATHRPEIGQPLDEQYFAYRDKFLDVYQKMTGKFPGQVEKEAIVKISQGAGACPERWERAIRETLLNYSGKSPPLQRMIDVYAAGGNYEVFKRQKWPDGQTGARNGNPTKHLSASAEENLRINKAANKTVDIYTGKHVILS